MADLLSPSPSPDEAPVVRRDNYLQSVDEALESTGFVVLGGPSGIGKTTILRQFTADTGRLTCECFLSSASRWAYEPQVVEQEIVAQLSAHFGVSPSGGEKEASLLDCYHALRKRARRHQPPCIFVVDGLEEVPVEDEHFVKQILSLLPFGVPGAKFVLSHDPTGLLPKTAKLAPSTITVVGFSVPETAAYLERLGLPRERVELIHKACAGKPSHLAVVRRILLNREAGTTLLESVPRALSELFEIEMGMPGIPRDGLQEELLSILAFADTQVDERMLGTLLSVSPGDLRLRLSGLAFVGFSGGSLFLTHQEYRGFLQSRFAGHRDRALGTLINWFTRPENAVQANDVLPSYLHRARRYEDLLALFRPDTQMHAVRYATSREALGKQIDLVRDAAVSLGRHGEVVRFSLSKSVLGSGLGLSLEKERIDLLVSLNRDPDALAVVNGARLREDRLMLLARYARRIRLEERVVSSETLDELRQLVDEASPSLQKRDAIALASDLLFSLPTSALEIIDQRSAGADGSDDQDWAFARMSIEAMQEARSETEWRPVVANIRKAMKGPAALEFATAVVAALADYSAEAVVQQASASERPDESISLLAHWVSANQKDPQSCAVALHAIDLMLRSPAFDPSPGPEPVNEFETPGVINSVFRSRGSRPRTSAC